jgi:TetR/AcrR family transcriptional regulator
VNVLGSEVAASPESSETIARILDAAESVFAARGYHGASTREIAEAAGIGKRMLFYWFASKDDLYRAVLDRIVDAMADIHERFSGEPAEQGLAAGVEAMTRFAAANGNAVRVLLREIMDDGPYVAELAADRLAPLFGTAQGEVSRSMGEGRYAAGDPMHVLLSVGGVTLFYFLNLPILRHLWDADPLAPEVIEERVRMTTDLLLHGLAGAAGRGGPS